MQELHSQVVVPGEWEDHETVWIAIPGKPGIYSDSCTVISIIRKLSEHVHTTLVVEDAALMARGKDFFHELEIDTAQISLADISPLSPWLRDIGPVFYYSGGQGELVGACDFRFTSYENVTIERAPKWAGALDEAGRKLSGMLGSRLTDSELVLEGGAFEVNGSGTIILVDSLMLNRNPSWSKAQIEAELADKLGIKTFIWLAQGLAQDPYGSRYYGSGIYATGTGGHTDHFVRFANDSTILLYWEPDALKETDPLRKLNYKRMAHNLEILENSTDHRGKIFQVIKIPSPGMFYQYKPINKALRAGLPELSGFEGGDTIRTAICASYLNYFLTNGLVLLPAYDVISDAVVRSMFQHLFPDREIYQVNPIQYNKLSGGIHCLTVQQPSRSRL
jgi:agmatine deiminase